MLAKINNIQHQRSGNFFLMAGPCAIESEAMAMEIAEKILSITNKLEIPLPEEQFRKSTVKSISKELTKRGGDII